MFTTPPDSQTSTRFLLERPGGGSFGREEIQDEAIRKEMENKEQEIRKESEEWEKVYGSSISRGTELINSVSEGFKAATAVNLQNLEKQREEFRKTTEMDLQLDMFKSGNWRYDPMKRSPGGILSDSTKFPENRRGGKELRVSEGLFDLLRGGGK